MLGLAFSVSLLIAAFVPLLSIQGADAHGHFVLLPDDDCAWLTNAGRGHWEGAHDTVHPIHTKLHVGTAGIQMDNPSNPVDVDKFDPATGHDCPGDFKNG